MLIIAQYSSHQEQHQNMQQVGWGTHNTSNTAKANSQAFFTHHVIPCWLHDYHNGLSTQRYGLNKNKDLVDVCMHVGGMALKRT